MPHFSILKKLIKIALEGRFVTYISFTIYLMCNPRQFLFAQKKMWGMGQGSQHRSAWPSMSPQSPHPSQGPHNLHIHFPAELLLTYQTASTISVQRQLSSLCRPPHLPSAGTLLPRNLCLGFHTAVPLIGYVAASSTVSPACQPGRQKL